MKKTASLLVILLLVFSLVLPARAARDLPHVRDDGDLLTAEQAEALEYRAAELSDTYGCDILILTVWSLDGEDPTVYADDYFDYSGYGRGADRSGVLLLLSMEYRDWAISTKGIAVDAFTDYGQEMMMDEVLPYFGAEEYAGGFEEFLASCETYLSAYETGQPVDVPDDHSAPNGQEALTESKPPRRVFTPGSVILAAVLGFAGAFVPMHFLKKQVRNVAPREDAVDYVSRPFDLTGHQDRFLYSRVSKTRRESDNDSSGRSYGGSSTHTSSSGSSHGGSSGKF